MNGTNPADGGRGRLFVWLQYAIPQHRLSRLVFAAARVRTPWFKNLLTRAFLKLFSVDMAEAIETDPYRYPSFNEFFTRALRPDARPIAAGAAAIASPVDGMVSECGAIDRDQLAAGQRSPLHARRICWRSRTGQSASREARLPRSISRLSTITAFTCRRAGGCSIRYTYRAACSA